MDAPVSLPANDAALDALLRVASKHAHQGGVSRIDALRSSSGLSEPALIAALGDMFMYRAISAGSLDHVKPDFECLPFGECVSRSLLLVRADASSGSFLRDTLVMADPFDDASETWALKRYQSKHAQPLLAPLPLDVVIADARDVEEVLRRVEGRLDALERTVDPGDPAGDEEETWNIGLAAIEAEENPIVRAVDGIIHDALRAQASDIHLESGPTSLRVQYRVDGVLGHVTSVAGRDAAEQVISRIKVMAELDISERRIPQDGRFKVRVQAKPVDFRVSIMPNAYGEDAVLRVLDRQVRSESAAALSLESLGLTVECVRSLRKMAAKPHGMLLVTGPTGSGKTTTLYAAITEVSNKEQKIVTIEDPVEYRLSGVLQVPVNEKKGLTFSRGLRSILRHDPDRIMVGEIRDADTAQIAVQAALTGHLVYTTVHANNVFDVLGRLLNMDVDAYSLAAALNGIVAQRLIRLNCTHCSSDTTADVENLEAAGLSLDDTSGWRWRVGTGCTVCRGTGYRGRKAVAETLLADDEFRDLIANRAPLSRMRAHASEKKFLRLLDSATQCVARGETTLAEVLRVVG